MMGHDIFFDVARGRVGFAESDCNYLSLVMEEGEEKDEVAEENTKVIEEIIEQAQELEDELVEEELSANNPESNEHDNETPVPSPPLLPADNPPPDDTESSRTEAFQLFGNDSQEYNGGAGGGMSDMLTDIIDDMKHECSSTSCRGVAGMFILAASVVVFVMVRRAVARRRVVRQYQEAELEISDLALDSDSSDDEGGYVDEPTMPQIT